MNAFFRKYRIIILLAALCLLASFSAKAQAASNALGASEACEDCTLGEVNGFPACMKEGKLHICDCNFPDSTFQSYLSGWDVDRDRDRCLSGAELALAEIDVYGLDYESLAGIEFFSDLVTLTCTGTSLTKLDVSANTALSELTCYNNSRLKKLNVTGCPALTNLNCRSNKLPSLDLSGCPGLVSLNCSYNRITELDVSVCPALTELDCSENLLTSLDVSACRTVLRSLSCWNNTLTALPLTGCSALEELYCYDNGLTELKLSGCPLLTVLHCAGNDLAALNTSHNPSLTQLYCYKNRLTSLNVAANPSLEILDCSNNSLTSLDVHQNLLLRYLACHDNELTALDLSVNAGLTSLNCACNRISTLDISAQQAIVPEMCQSDSVGYDEDYGDRERVVEYRTGIGVIALAVDKEVLIIRGTGTGYTGGSVEFTCSFPENLLPYIQDPLVSLRWQESKDGGTTWKNVSSGIQGYNASTLVLPITAARNKCYYRCVAGYESGAAKTMTGVYILTVLPRITTQPASVSTTAGKTAVFTVTATGAGLTYRWQYRTSSSGAWKNKSSTSAGYNTDTLSVPATAARHGYQYRCKVTDASGRAVYSNAATLKVLGFAAQPASVSTTAGKTASFEVTATNARTYQWQYRTSPSGEWKNCSESLTGYNAAVLKVAAKTYRHGYQYRCRIKDPAGRTVYSNAATLNVLGIRTQPSSVSTTAGKTATFTITASGAGLTYRWQYRTSSSGTWKNSSATGYNTAALKISATTARHGYQYRCKVTDAAGNTVYSDAATLEVLGITAQPSSVTVSAGKTAAFEVTATNVKTYRWQYRTSAAGEWKDCSTAGYNTATLKVVAKSYRNVYQYRCKVTDAAGNTVYSNAATLTVK